MSKIPSKLVEDELQRKNMKMPIFYPMGSRERIKNNKRKQSRIVCDVVCEITIPSSLPGAYSDGQVSEQQYGK